MLQNHSEACRSRIESRLAGTTWGQARLNHARDRITQRIVDMSADKGPADSNPNGADPSSDLPGGPPTKRQKPNSDVVRQPMPWDQPTSSAGGAASNGSNQGVSSDGIGVANGMNVGPTSGGGGFTP